MTETDPIERYRAEFFRHPEITHMNNAGVTPLPQCTVETVQNWLRRRFEEGAFSSIDLRNESSVVRRQLARFLGAKENEVAFFGCTAQGLSQMAFGLDFKPGDEIITWQQEYPSSFYPWRDAARRSGAKLVVLASGPENAVSVETIIQHVTPRTRLIATSWVQYQTGAILDLKQLADFARPRGILTVVDGIQGLGILPFHFHETGVDAIAGGSHKWLTSPHSTGFLCLREELIPRVRPLMVGALTYGSTESANDLTAERKFEGASYEPGSKNFFDIAGLGRSLQLIEETGVARIAQEAEWLSRTLLHGLRERGYVIHSPHGTHHRGAILTFSAGTHSACKSVPEIERALTRAKISYAPRALGIRLSPHAFNTKDDIDKVLESL